MASNFNLRGTSYPSFQIGNGGPTILTGTSMPGPSIGVEGDLFIVHALGASTLYIKTGGGWGAVSDPSLSSIVAITQSLGLTIVSNGADWKGSDTVGIVVGNPTGGYIGTGTINAENVLINGVPVAAGVNQLNDLTDVVLTGLTPNDIFHYNGTKWVNVAVGSGAGIQPFNSRLVNLASLTPGVNDFIVGDGSGWTSITGDMARSSLNLGTASNPAFNSLILTSGNITRGASGGASIFSDAGANYISIGGSSSTAYVPGNVQVLGDVIIGSGQTQTVTYLEFGMTNDNTLTEIFLDGTSMPIILGDNSTWAFDINITARRIDTPGDNAVFFTKGCIIRDMGAASTAIIGDLEQSSIKQSLPWDITVDANISNGSLRIQVLGENGKDIRWAASIKTTQVTN